MIRMLLVGYCCGIRSERRLCQEVHLNLAYRWFCRLDLNDAVPNHSTFSKNRHGRFRDCDLFRQLFETVLARCIAEGLVGGEAFGIDASLIKAEAREPRRWDRAERLAAEDYACRATSEYLDTLDDAAFGAATPVQPKYLSPVDPAARWSAADRGKAHFLYSTNYLVDLDHAVIVDVEETTAPIRQAENRAARDMIERVMDRFGLYPERLVGDTGYGARRCSAGSSTSTASSRIFPSSTSPPDATRPSPDPTSSTTATKTPTAVRQANGCATIAAHTRRREGADADNMVRYRSSKPDCDACALKQRCTPREPSRKIVRSIHEGARDMARDIAKTDAYVILMCQRKKVEMLFAHLKRILKLDRLRLRGPNGARDEFHLAATAQNLRKLAKLVPMAA